MNKGIILCNPSQIDLCKHGVLEAHAGTGKTYTIVQMVLRIVQEPYTDSFGVSRYIHIREILLVTFTEKSAGELKLRIRQGLENALGEIAAAKKDEELWVHVSNCLNNLHEAFIGTIHGVCLRLLQTWPFETGIHFNTEIVDDKEGLAETLRDSIRTDWQNTATFIPWALNELIELSEPIKDKQLDIILEIALIRLDSLTTALDKRCSEGLNLEGIKELLEPMRKALNDGESVAEFYELLKEYSNELTNILKNSLVEEKRIELAQKRLGDINAMLASQKFSTKILKNPFKVKATLIATKDQVKKDSRLSHVSFLAESISAHSHCQILSECERLEALLQVAFVSDAAEYLKDRWDAKKKKQGLVSFHDMVSLLNNACSNNKFFVEALQKRLRFGIIDEFQDTSILGWKIFETVFLAKKSASRLFIVGDPKQSIYSFQGADVQSYMVAKNALQKNDGLVYYLTKNYRSLPETISSYNTIFASDNNNSTESNNWFAFEEDSQSHKSIDYPCEGVGGEVAKPPHERMGVPSFPLSNNALSVMLLEGSALKRRQDMAVYTSSAIKSLIGKTISVPDGLGWKDIVLEYKDFAVIVESHRLAVPFLTQFQTDGIPCVKYKMEGVFQSSTAHEIYTLLQALVAQKNDQAPMLALLLTTFFNKHPALVNPVKDLEPCGNAYCGVGNHTMCLFHAMELWKEFALRRQWSLLFESIEKRSGFKERAIRLIDGKRIVADFDQIRNYCIALLYRKNCGLSFLVEHLYQLMHNEISVGDDRNIFTLATDMSSVKILTMHASKGLEFPVVFVVTGASEKNSKGFGICSWSDGSVKRIMPTATFKKDYLADLFSTEYDLIPPIKQAKQERRRLLYVALTRAMALLFVPAHFQKIAYSANAANKKQINWAETFLPDTSFDNDLTPRLKNALEHNLLEAFDINNYNTQSLLSPHCITDHLDENWTLPQSIEADSQQIVDQLEMLHISDRISFQTSYSELSRKMISHRSIDKSDEENDVAVLDLFGTKEPMPILPGGKSTGNALHEALEELLTHENPEKAFEDLFSAREIVEKALLHHNVFKWVDSKTDNCLVVDAAFGLLRSSLTQPYLLPDGTKVILSDLPKNDRITEMEFLLHCKENWVHGFMDLVFRVKNESAVHPYCYYVLDWKSDRLNGYNADTILECVTERHYDLQAKIYCHALEKYLKGILKETYNATHNLGGALYVFLRGFENSTSLISKNVWFKSAMPSADEQFTNDCLKQLIKGRYS